MKNFNNTFASELGFENLNIAEMHILRGGDSSIPPSGGEDYPIYPFATSTGQASQSVALVTPTIISVSSPLQPSTTL